MHHPDAIRIGVVSHIQERNDLNTERAKACLLQAAFKITRQLGMWNMPVPGIEDAAHARIVTAGPDRRLPIRINQ